MASGILFYFLPMIALQRPNASIIIKSVPRLLILLLPNIVIVSEKEIVGFNMNLKVSFQYPVTDSVDHDDDDVHRHKIQIREWLW